MALFEQVHGASNGWRRSGSRKLAQRQTFFSQFRHGFHHFAHFTLLMPLALIGAFLFLKWGGRRFAPRVDVVATTKIIAGLVLTLLMYGLVVSAAVYWPGPFKALWVGLCLPVSGLAFVRVMDRIRLMTKVSRTVMDLFFHRRVRRKLINERNRLKQAVDEAVTAFLPENMERLFPPLEERKP